MFKWLKDAFRFDGIQDEEIQPDSDWHYLTPMERIGIQTQADADIARGIIKERKKLATYNMELRPGLEDRESGLEGIAPRTQGYASESDK